MLYFAGGYPGLYFPRMVLPPPPVQLLDLEVEIPMALLTGLTSRPVPITSSWTQSMGLFRAVAFPLTHGMAERAEIPMRVTSRATMELH
jgi:hypothetical protein